MLDVWSQHAGAHYRRPRGVFAAAEIPANFIFRHKIKIISLQGIEVSEIGCFPLEPVGIFGPVRKAH